MKIMVSEPFEGVLNEIYKRFESDKYQSFFGVISMEQVLYHFLDNSTEIYFCFPIKFNRFDDYSFYIIMMDIKIINSLIIPYTTYIDGYNSCFMSLSYGSVFDRSMSLYLSTYSVPKYHVETLNRNFKFKNNENFKSVVVPTVNLRHINSGSKVYNAKVKEPNRHKISLNLVVRDFPISSYNISLRESYFELAKEYFVKLRGRNGDKCRVLK